MIKKQFTFLKDTVAPNIKTPIVFNNETMSIGEVLNKLNELSNENEQLKQENNKLQGEYDYLLWLYNGLGCEYDWLKEENEQLKKRIKEAIIHYDQATQTLNEKFDKMSGFEELPVAMSAIGFDIKNKWVFDLDSILYIILSI